MSTYDHRGIFALRTREDSGFTIIEILMALVILLIAFSGVMSLMMANTLMNVRAKQRTTLVNEANSYIERVRDLPFNEIGTSSSTPPGSLAPYTTTTADGYVLTVVPTVTMITDSSILAAGVPKTGILKRLNIVITATRPGSQFAPMTYSAETVIKETDSGMNAAAVKPTIRPTASSQASDGVVVSGDSWEIGAVATANGSGVILTSMNFYCDGVALRDRSGGRAQWTMNSASETRNFMWNTGAFNEDSVALSPDGYHTIKIEVWDSNGRQAWYQWRVLVDNNAPVWPVDGWLTANAPNSTQVALAWSPCYDGTELAHHYIVEAQKFAGGSTYTALTPVSYSTNQGVFTSLPFTQYQFRVTAVGPPSLNMASATSTWTACTTRPELSGTWKTVGTKTSMDTTLTVRLTPPTWTYAYATTKSYLYKSTSPTMVGATQVGAAVPTVNFASPQNFTVATVTGSGWPTAVQYYYQAKTVVGTQTYYSQIVGPNGAGPHGIETGTLATVRW